MTGRRSRSNLPTSAAGDTSPCPSRSFCPTGPSTQPELGAGDPVDAFAQEITVAADAIASGREADRLSGKLARQALSLCLAEIESVKTQAVVTLV